MEYFSILNLNREPFSNSPDPEYFFQSTQHIGCLQKLELSLRLRRGLNVVLGDVGTGKTTLCRQLIRRFSQDEDYETHLVLDPQFSNPLEFLTTVVEMFTGKRIAAKATNDWQLKEVIKKYIFRRGVDEKKTVVLIIDEGQKLPEFCLEILREFLNYETNEYKLLQIAIFAQKEFQKTLETYANFADRINLYHILGPMNFRDTRKMIQFRLKQSSEKAKTPRLFSYPALWAIYKNTGGYPRKIINLCHQCVLAMIIQNKTKAGWFLVRSCVKRVSAKPAMTWRRITVTALVGIAIILLAVGLAPEGYKQLVVWKSAEMKSADVPNVSSRSEGLDNPGTAPPLMKVSLPEPRSSNEAVPETDKNIDPGVSVKETEKPLVKTTAEAAVKAPDIESRLPTVLGHVALRRSDTLWRLIEKIYGNFENQYLEALLKANPRIKNPDEVEAGRRVAFPAIPATVRPLSVKAWWVQVDEKDRLDAAVNTLRSYPGDAPPVRMIPYWNHVSGLKFALLYKDCFFDETSAQNYLNALHLKAGAKSNVLSGWEEHTVFYADPYRVLR